MRLPTLLFLLLLSTPTQALDVTHYDLELGLRADTEVLEGRAVLDLVLDDADAAAAHVELDFVGLEITSVLVQGLPTADWSRDGGLLSLPLPPGSVSGTQVRIEISYTGAPEPYVAPWGTWGVVRSQDRVFTVNVTEGARHWFPCHDRLEDKATVDLAVTVPDPWLVAAAGTLEEQVPLDGGRTRFRWSAAWPIPTYLIHFAAGPYMLTEEEHGGVPFFYWLHPTLYGDAADTFAHAPDALEMLTARYGPYPFPKVGFDEIDLGGAVEHPSCISLGTQLLTPTRSYEEVIAHELAHAWFQGVVTVASWDDVWLSEGMATYHEALYHEHVHGPGTLADYMESLAISYRTLAEMSEGQFPLSAPEVLFGVTTYRKGALVLHALSYLMGRDVFDVFLSDYLEAFAWSSASA
ncbi:MAG: M1 family metallopeptidase, partial [Deltaproteobacteria bacterium]|nr:M1 family metallopeptidase [Deltaproteobacteria bacterium]